MSTTFGPTAAEISQAALEYVEGYRWHIVPLHSVRPDGSCSCRKGTLCRSAGKHPCLLEDWQHAASNDSEQVARWLEQWPDMNIGLSLGQRSAVIDVESDGDDGNRLLDELLGNCFTPTYSSGRGKHRLFRFDEKLLPARAVVKARGIEFRIGHGGKGAQSVLPPSRHHSGKQYRWLPELSPSGVAVAPLPAALLALLWCDEEPDQPLHAVEGREKELAISALSGLKPSRCEEYADWLRIGMALHSVGDDMLAEWDRWSQACPAKYRSGECATRWRSFRRGVGVTVGTLIFMAKQDGWTPPTDLVKSTSYRLTDTGNAELLVARHGDDMLYCHPWKEWLVFDGSRWAPDQTGKPRQLAIDACRAMQKQALDIDDLDKRKRVMNHAMGSENEKRITAMLKQAQSFVPILPAKLDVDPWTLNCPNGTLDLRTGDLRSHRREDFITKLCPTAYDLNAKAPHFDRFMHSIFEGDKELVDFVLRLLGYSLTGSTREDVFPIFWGKGSNGKSTLINLLLHVLGGDFAISCDKSLIAEKKHEGHSTERMDLFGKRLAVCSETKGGMKLDESFVKMLTGRDPIRGRKICQNTWEFIPTHKLILCTNHKPIITDSGHGMWRRVALVPFNVKFWDASKGESGPPELECDKNLEDTLKAEAPGILAAIARGCVQWQETGLAMPPAVQVATKKYRNDSDWVSRFLRECCDRDPEHSVNASALFKSFEEWVKDYTDGDVSQRWFGDQMTELGFSRKRSNGMKYQGVRVAR